VSTLKELTAEVHAEAENQPFIKSIFAGNVDKKNANLKLSVPIGILIANQESIE
jgi:hypothetical protein